MSRAALGVIRFTEEQQRRIVVELAHSGVLQLEHRPDDEEVAVLRARQDCAVCDRGHRTAEAIKHHNLRASEYGERVYPCTRRSAA
jgi:hypothetical protein